MRVSSNELAKNMQPVDNQKTLIDHMGKRKSSSGYFADKFVDTEEGTLIKQALGGSQSPDWSTIPSKKESPYSDEKWVQLIADAAESAAKRGDKYGAEFDRLLTSYISSASPDRKAFYYQVSAGGGNPASLKADNSILGHDGKKWTYNLTDAEQEKKAEFLFIYQSAYQKAQEQQSKRMSISI